MSNTYIFLQYLFQAHWEISLPPQTAFSRESFMDSWVIPRQILTVLQAIRCFYKQAEQLIDLKVKKVPQLSPVKK